MNQHIVFTLCSNNYLAEAKALGDSLLKHNPGYKFIIGLVDKKSPLVDYSVYSNFEILEASQIGIKELDEMVLKYNIVELNTSVKPFYFNYLFARLHYTTDNYIFYFDPDIVIYEALDPVEAPLISGNAVLTPHIMSPIPLDNKYPNEQLFLMYGIYNLGFIGLKWSEATKQMLLWWGERLQKLGYADLASGLYVDQLWMNLAPLLFEGCHILRHPGANVAFWNLHERTIKPAADKWVVNNSHSLLFFHFSAFVLKDENIISRYSTRYTVNERPGLKSLLDDYRQKLEKNNISFLKTVPCAYVTERNKFLVGKRRTWYRKNPHLWMLAKIKPLIPLSVKRSLTGK